VAASVGLGVSRGYELLVDAKSIDIVKTTSKPRIAKLNASSGPPPSELEVTTSCNAGSELEFIDIQCS
jgi:hypothetical protein